jgi:protease I
MDMPGQIDGTKVAILVSDGFEQVEMTSPRDALQKAGAETKLVAPVKGTVQGWNHHDKAETFDVEVPLKQANAEEFDALLLPGGVMNPDDLRRDPVALAFVRKFFEQKKPVAAICHGPWTLIDAGVVPGRKLTSYPSIQNDLKNAGAQWVDEPVVVDDHLVTSRSPKDLPAFNQRIVEKIGECAQPSRCT